MTSPIKPEDVVKQKYKYIPDWIISTVNELIVKNWDGGYATISQAEIISQYLGDDPFDYSWLDFESIFGGAGWKVVYNRPNYNETYGAYFVFTKA